MILRDRRAIGQARTLTEHPVDMERIRRQRLQKVQAEMTNRDIGALLLTDIVNIRYATGIAVMPIWTSTNLAHYVLVPVQGSPIIFEYSKAMFRAEEFWNDVRPAHYWQSRFVDNHGAEYSAEWAQELQAVLREHGLADAQIGIDVLDFHGMTALQQLGLRLCDADETIEAARVIKTDDEVEMMRLACAVAEAALHDLEQAIRPGVTENELLGVFWHTLCALGGEYCYTRLLASGYKTNPWFHECGSKMVRPGDLVGFDTDMIGPEGFACDISRTFLCGDDPTPVQKEAYKVAYDFVMGTAELLKPGASYAEVVNSVPVYPEEYKAQRYSVILHGTGTDDEPPFLPFPDDPLLRSLPEGEFEENMVISVEFYAGKVGEQDGVKLEDEVLITADGPVLLSLYPYERKLMA